MIVQYSKSFEKAVEKLSGKIIYTITDVIKEVKQAERLEDISNCKKIKGLDNVYRIRTGSYRTFFTFHIYVEGDTVKFEYLVSRGQAYDKHILSNLQKKHNKMSPPFFA